MRTVYAARKTIVAPGRTIGPGSSLAERGAANGDNAADAVRLAARWARTQRSTLIGPFGRTRGDPWAAHRRDRRRNPQRPHRAAHRHRSSCGQPIDKGGARTRGDGRFTVILPRDVSSRTLVLRYRSHANDTVAAAERVARTEGPGRNQAGRDATGGHSRPHGTAQRTTQRPAAAAGRARSSRCRREARARAWITFRTVRTARRGTIRHVVHLPARRPCPVRDARPGEGDGRLSVRNRVLAGRPRPRALTAARYRSPPMNRVLVTGGAGTIGAAVVRRLLRDPDFEVRVSDQRAGARLDARGLRGPHRRPAGARRGARGDAGLHARDPPGGDRRRDRQLPQAAPHADRGQQRALQRRRARGPRPRRRALHLRLELDGLRARDRVPDDRGAHRRHADPALGLRLLQAHGRGLRARGARRARPALHDLPPFQRLRARARCPRTSRASPTWSPTSSASA